MHASAATYAPPAEAAEVFVVLCGAHEVVLDAHPKIEPFTALADQSCRVEARRNPPVVNGWTTAASSAG
jgi:hypothetical protein